MKKCEECGFETENNHSFGNHVRYGCKGYPKSKSVLNKEWREKNREKLKKYQKNYIKSYKARLGDKFKEKCKEYISKYRIKNRNKYLVDKKLRRIELRFMVLKEYGGKCVCCGESNLKFLVIDHIYNDGASHRKKYGLKNGLGIYVWLKQNQFPKDRYQVLCHNCNSAKQYWGLCPHMEKKNV